MTAQRRTGFRDIKQTIVQRIHGGMWGPGDLLPGETTLAEEFGCARTTVNRALRELSEEGLIERKRKAGTRVRRSPLRSARFHIPLVREEIEATGVAYRYSLIVQEKLAAPDWLRARLELPPDSQTVHVRCVHYAGSEPYQYEDRWINCAAVPAITETTFETESPNEWLVRQVPFSSAEISFFAISAGRTAAEFLQVDEGEPVFGAERVTWWNAKPVTLAHLFFQRGYRMTTLY